MFYRFLLTRTNRSTPKPIREVIQRNVHTSNNAIVKKQLLSPESRIVSIPWATLSTSPLKSKTIHFSWKSFTISAILIGIFGGWMYYLKEVKMLKMEKQRKKALGDARMGGEFELIDHNGRLFSSKELEGKWVLLYFGFTHCPDVCPDELEKLVATIDALEKNKKADPIKPVFITVDPDRDDVKAVREYLAEFSPKILGLTGSKDQIQKATKSYRVYYSSGPRDHENDYIVDHTIITYLIDPDGRLVDYYGQTKTCQDMQQGILKAMSKYRKLNQKF